MIAHVRGEITEKTLVGVIIDVDGVGYELNVPSSDLDTLSIGSTVKLATYFAVRENAQELYGFVNAEAKRLFEMLLTVSGVGPKVALSIVSLGDPAQVKAAIADANVAYIQSANGVGKRGAEKVIVELQDKVGTIELGGSVLEGISRDDDALTALLALGYTSPQATQALADVDNSLPVESRVKQALATLGGGS